MQSKPDQREYILKVLAKTGWTQTELAKRAGLDPSTLSRFLVNERAQHTLRASTIHNIEKVTGLKLVTGTQVVGTDEAKTGFAEPEAIPLPLSDDPELSATISLLAGRLPNVDPWVLKSRALELAGYRPGDVLLVRLGETPLQGDIVCVQVYDWPKGRAETMFRVFEPPFLVSATTDPKLFKPFSAGDESIAIKGVVLQSIRSRNPLF